MKYQLLILLLAFLASCSNSEIEQTAAKKSDKTELKLKGVEICNCPEPFDKAEYQVRVSYQNNFLKFCAFDFIPSKRLATEFRIFDENDSVVFLGDGPYMFKVSEFKEPLRLIMFTETAIHDSEETESIPAVEYLIQEENGKFLVKEKLVLVPPVMTRQKMDSVLSIFRNQPIHDGNYNEKDPPFATEEFEMDLFICALNGNRECLEAFENLETRFVTDGAIAELYTELDYLLHIYKKEKYK